MRTEWHRKAHAISKVDNGIDRCTASVGLLKQNVRPVTGLMAPAFGKFGAQPGREFLICIRVTYLYYLYIAFFY